MLRATIFRWPLVLCLCLLAGLPTRHGVAAEKPLIFGILPFTSHVSLFNRYAHLRDYLSQRLGCDVVLESASNYPTFVQRTHQRRYDLVLTAPHFVPYELDDGHYQALATYPKPLSAVFLARRDSDIRNIAQLNGKTIATPPKQAIITLAGKHYLSDHRRVGDKAPTYKEYKSHNAAYHAAAGGETEAAVISVSFLYVIHEKQLPLRIIGKSPDFPGMGVLGSLDLEEKLRTQITDILVGMHEDPAGRAILKKMTHPGFRRIQPGEFNALRPYLALLPDYRQGR